VVARSVPPIAHSTVHPTGPQGMTRAESTMESTPGIGVGRVPVEWHATGEGYGEAGAGSGPARSRTYATHAPVVPWVVIHMVVQLHQVAIGCIILFHTCIIALTIERMMRDIRVRRFPTRRRSTFDSIYLYMSELYVFPKNNSNQKKNGVLVHGCMLIHAIRIASALLVLVCAVASAARWRS
jgi:hypothetical protein